jgi:hypothetical protein
VRRWQDIVTDNHPATSTTTQTGPTIHKDYIGKFLMT